MTKILATSSAGGFRPVSEGLHLAQCVAVVDLGVQPGSEKWPRVKHKVYLKFVINDEEVEWERDGKTSTGPAILGATYTLSLGENSRLRPLVEGMRGRRFTPEELKGFDISSLAGQPCQIQVLHEQGREKTFAVIASIVAWPKGTPVPALAEPPLVYSPAAHDPVTFAKLPAWLQEVISKRLADNYAEYDRKAPAPKAKPEARPVAPPSDANSFSDDIPF